MSHSIHFLFILFILSICLSCSSTQQIPQSKEADITIAIDSMRFYLVQSSEISEKRFFSKSETDKAQMENEIKILCEKGYPFLQFLHNEQPKNCEWLGLLMNVAPILGKNEDYLLYEARFYELKQN